MYIYIYGFRPAVCLMTVHVAFHGASPCLDTVTAHHSPVPPPF